MLGLAFTPEGYPAKMDGSMWRGRGDNSYEKSLQGKVKKKVSDILVAAGNELAAIRQMKNLTAEQRDYAEFLAAARGKVDHQSKADEYGVSNGTLGQWRADLSFKEYLAAKLGEFVCDEARWLMILNVLEDMALEGDTVATSELLSLMAKIRGPFTAAAPNQADRSTLAGLSEEEILRLAEMNPVSLGAKVTGDPLLIPDGPLEE